MFWKMLTHSLKNLLWNISYIWKYIGKTKYKHVKWYNQHLSSICTPIYVEQMFKFLSIKIEVGQYALPEHSNSGYVSLRLNFMHIYMYIP